MDGKESQTTITNKDTQVLNETNHTTVATNDTSTQQLNESEDIAAPTDSTDNPQVTAENTSSIRVSQRNLNKARVENFQIKIVVCRTKQLHSLRTICKTRLLKSLSAF